MHLRGISEADEELFRISEAGGVNPFEGLVNEQATRPDLVVASR